MKKTAFLLALASTTLSYGQEKKKLDYTAYDSWNSVQNIRQSPKGKTIVFETTPYEGDGILSIYSGNIERKKTFARGSNPQIHCNDQYIAFTIRPQFDSIRSLKLDGVKTDNLPKDSLGVYIPSRDTLYKHANVSSFEVSEKGDWMVYHSTEDLREPAVVKKCLFKKKTQEELQKTSGKTLFLVNPILRVREEHHQVTEYHLTEDGAYLFLTKSIKYGETDSLYLHVIDLEKGTEMHVSDGLLSLKKLSYHEDSQQLVFFSSLDTNKKKNVSLNYWTPDMGPCRILIDSMTTGMPSGHNISVYRTPQFSEDGTKLFIGTQKILRPEPEDTLLKSEKVSVDIWGNNDLRIQPLQLNSAKRDAKHTQAAIYHFSTKKFVSVDTAIRTFIPAGKGNPDLSLGITSIPYQREVTWAYPWRRDYYLVSHTTGTSELLMEGHAYSASLSPSGTYFSWYSGSDSTWYVMNVATRAQSTLMSAKDGPIADEQNGYPFIPFSQGDGGWTNINGQEHFIINTTHHFWVINPESPAKRFSPSRAINPSGSITYRYERQDWDSLYTDLSLGYIHGVDQETKGESYHAMEPTSDGAYTPNHLISSDHRYIQFQKAEESNQYLIRRMNFQKYPEIEVVREDNFDNPITLSNTNPQQADYYWGSVELIHWQTEKGDSLDGLLYLPEDYDSTASYPMIVYYYEENSHNLHTHYVPKPTASIVYATEYVSNGYVIFIPDIHYEVGHPAQSAYDCIMSGTDYVLENYPAVDSTRMGLQGQSWGGYQTAQLITMTERYSAAMAGAPVSNMFSAYGGIRWGSGHSRMFQYERGQSRIGATIWESPELYIENSPVFGLPNVRTPLLIMHNDNDGAVPWYQGIELYMGLRRLDSPVWLLNYNGDEHNLMQTANRRDLSRRMRQFFDHYLLSAPAPIWMTEGIPATEKGKNMGFELKK